MIPVGTIHTDSFRHPILPGRCQSSRHGFSPIVQRLIQVGKLSRGQPHRKNQADKRRRNQRKPSATS